MTLTSEFLSDDDIVNSVQQTGESAPFDEVNIDTEEPHAVVSTKEAQDAVLTLRRFFEQQVEGILLSFQDRAVKTHSSCYKAQFADQLPSSPQHSHLR